MTVVCSDALSWLEAQSDQSLGHVVTGIPDMNDVNMTPEEYRDWVQRLVRLLAKKCKRKAYIMLCQTDRRINKVWIDKTSIIVPAAEEAGAPLRWHKIVVKKLGVDVIKPTYSHILCFSAESGPGKGFPDVIYGGKSLYVHGTPVHAVKLMVDFAKRFGPPNIDTVVDPFVGRGTTLAIAKMNGFKAIGVDISESQCRYAETLSVDKVQGMLQQTASNLFVK
jgi:hypothetical protein